MHRVGLWITFALPAAALLVTANAAAADPPAEGADKASADKDKAADDKSGSAGASAGASAAADASGTTAGADAKADAGSKEAAAAEATPGEAPGAPPAPEVGAKKLAAPPSDVARLPAEAYPDKPVRGIYGGSLWMTFHGLQWPVDPFETDEPRTRLGFSGSVWIDTGYKKVDTELPNAPQYKKWLQQGRLVLRATPTYTKNDWFVQGQAELVANKDQTVAQPNIADVDDLWVKAGKWNKFDVQVGRFEAWELFHFGMGLDLNTLERQGAWNEQNTNRPPDVYGVTFAYYRPSGVGNVAFHAYPLNFLRFEALGQIGNESNLNTMAARGTAILDIGMVKVKAGAEFKHASASLSTSKSESDSRGGGGAVQLVINPRVEAGFNGAYALVDSKDSMGNMDPYGSITTFSVGGFANVRLVGELILGVGATYTYKEDLHEDTNGNVDESSQMQGFGALQILVLDQLFLKAVVAYAKADYADSFTMSPPYSDKMLSARLRAMYLF